MLLCPNQDGWWRIDKEVYIPVLLATGNSVEEKGCMYRCYWLPVIVWKKKGVCTGATGYR